MAIGLGYERLPLGFELKLVKFRHGKNPGQMGDASFASTVELVDRAKGIDQQRTISMNEPLVYGKYTLYQSSFQETPEGKQASTLTVACDPGRLLKYLGSLMICGGALLMFFCSGDRLEDDSLPAAPAASPTTARRRSTAAGNICGDPASMAPNRALPAAVKIPETASTNHKGHEEHQANIV